MGVYILLAIDGTMKRKELSLINAVSISHAIEQGLAMRDAGELAFADLRENLDARLASLEEIQRYSAFMKNKATAPMRPNDPNLSRRCKKRSLRYFAKLYKNSGKS